MHWAMDVIYDFYYIHGPMECTRRNQLIFAVLDVSLNSGLDKTSMIIYQSVNELEQRVSYISRSHHYSTMNISETIQNTHMVITNY